MYTAVRFLSWAATQSARSRAWPTVGSASTRTASRSPQMSVAEVGCHRNCLAPGGGASDAVGVSSVTYTSQERWAAWIVIETTLSPPDPERHSADTRAGGHEGS